MKLSNERFEIEIISKSEFVDDYSAENKNFSDKRTSISARLTPNFSRR